MRAIIGIDVSKAKLDCLWLRDHETLKVKAKVIPNTAAGHEQLLKWVENNTGRSIKETLFVMEATGIYHEKLAYRLHKAEAQVAVINPAQARDYAKSLGVRTKNDSKDRMVLARFGATQPINLWQPEPEEVRELKALLSRLDAMQADIQREMNRLEKAKISQTSEDVETSIHNVLKHLTEEKQRLEKRIDDHMDGHPQLKEDKRLLETIPGVGGVISNYMVAAFHSRQFCKASQMAAYFGLVPIEHESGSSVRHRPRLSKAGNAKVRAKLYMPAIVASRYNPDAHALYTRLLERGKSKMAALGAVMRKLVHICFGVLKHQQVYCPQAI
ncbi:MAG: IS110 family transposase [Candidatus Sedimenticola sp. (ex Thyasira tokunagai)]